MHTTSAHATWRVLAALLVLSACDRPAAPSASATSLHDHGMANPAPQIDDATEAQLRSLKQATAPFRDFAVAQGAGYTTRVTGCYQNLPVGTMGFHYGDASRFDATLEVTRPEVLLYERQPDQSMRLVGVEYIIPFSAWTDPNPPVLFGQPLMRNLTFNVWALHAWVWRKNPRGIFADWNPDVHC